MPSSLGKSLCAFAALLFFAASGQADPLAELKNVSSLGPLDLARLKSGEIVVHRGTASTFSRGISIQSCYFINAAAPVVGERLLHWDPAKHPKMETRLYREYVLPPSREIFQPLQLNPAKPNDRWLLDRLLQIADGASPSDLHLTAADVAFVRKQIPAKSSAPNDRYARANDVWQQLLFARSNSLARGGISAVAPYGSDTSISPDSEFRGLLSLNPRVEKYFNAIVRAKPIEANGPPSDEAVGYWETTQIRGHTTEQVGLFAARKSPGAWQMVDCVYYPTDTYFMALNLFQLWPVDGGTLVWQIGFVSAPFRSYLGGLDRYIAGKQMTEETIDTIKTFRADFERAR
jgi:hypothetical protein